MGLIQKQIIELITANRKNMSNQTNVNVKAQLLIKR